MNAYEYKKNIVTLRKHSFKAPIPEQDLYTSAHQSIPNMNYTSQQRQYTNKMLYFGTYNKTYH